MYNAQQKPTETSNHATSFPIACTTSPCSYAFPGPTFTILELPNVRVDLPERRYNLSRPLTFVGAGRWRGKAESLFNNVTNTASS